MLLLIMFYKRNIHDPRRLLRVFPPSFIVTARRIWYRAKTAHRNFEAQSHDVIVSDR